MTDLMKKVHTLTSVRMLNLTSGSFTSLPERRAWQARAVLRDATLRRDSMNPGRNNSILTLHLHWHSIKFCLLCFAAYTSD